MKIIFVNRFFFPDQSATSQLLTDLVFDALHAPYEIHVIASRQRYNNALSKLPKRESIGGVHIHRIGTTRFGRGNLVGRSFDYLTFYIGAAVRLILLVGRGDIVVAKTDPPMLSVVVAMSAGIRSGRLVNWLQDLFPEVAAATRIKWARGVVLKILLSIRDWSLHRAMCNVVVGERMRDILQSRGVDLQRIVMVPNWADGEAICPLSSMENPLRKEWGLVDKFVVGYSGNLGRVHEFGTLLSAMKDLAGDTGVQFVFIGAGRQRQWLEKECKCAGLATAQFFPYQERESLVWSLGVPDVHLVSLLPDMEGYVVPSKFYGILAAGKPAIFIGDPEGEIGSLVRNFDCGFAIRQGDGPGLTNAIRCLKEDDILRKRLGENARTLFDERYEKKIALKAWSEVIARVSR